MQLSPAPSALYRNSCENVPRHRIFATKVCIANMHPTITRKTMQRHRVLAAKGCIANRKTVITGKILQRHRLFGSKVCIASGGTEILDRMKDGAALRHTLDVLRGTIVQGMMFSPPMNCAPKVGHKVKCNGKSELFSKNSSSTDARVREKYQFNLS